MVKSKYYTVIVINLLSAFQCCRQCLYSRITPSPFVPKLLPKCGSVLDPQHASAKSAGQSTTATASGDPCRHAVLWCRTFRDKRRVACSGTQPLCLWPGPLHLYRVLFNPSHITQWVSYRGTVVITTTCMSPFSLLRHLISMFPWVYRGKRDFRSYLRSMLLTVRCEWIVISTDSLHIILSYENAHVLW